MSEKVILCDMDLSQLTEYMTENFAVKPFVAGQLYGWLIKGADFADMKSVSNHFNVDFVAGLSYDFPCGLILEGRYVLSTNSVNVDGGIKTGALQMLVGWQF